MAEPTPDSQPSEPQKPSLECRFILRSLNGIARWSPLGGSSFAFATFLLRQEWGTAALLFPVTAVSGVWAAYSQNFVERLSEIYAERAKQDAEGLVAWLDSLNEALKWQFSGFEQNYLNCQADECRRDKTEGYSYLGISRAELTEVFVPLRIDTNFSRRLDGRDQPDPRRDERPDRKRYTIWDFLAQVRPGANTQRIAILAEGGSGKTTLMRHIAYSYATGTAPRSVPRLVPVLLYLRDLKDTFAHPPFPSLVDLINQHHLAKLPKVQQLEPPPNWAENLLQEGKALVMVDGFDEVDEERRNDVSEWITAQMHQYRRATFLLTSRPTGYQDYTADRPDTHLTVSPFNEAERDEFIQKWYLSQHKPPGGKLPPDLQYEAMQRAANLSQQIQQRRELAQMATNPLLLKMIATFHFSYPGAELPIYPAELYRDICKLQLIDRPKARRIAMPLHDDQRQQVLQRLALHMVEQEAKQLPQTDLLRLIQPWVTELDATADPATFLRQVVRVSELLVEREPEVYEFAHLNFRDYLAAEELKRIQGEDRLLANFTSNHWEGTTLLYAGLANVTNLVRSVCAEGSVLALGMAYRCVRACPYPLDPSLSQQLNSTVYLERFLQAGQWKNADLETYRLMIQAVGKEYGNGFSLDELRNFPCELLLELCDLWERYSEGKFGFRAQKQIWQECGSPTSYNDDWKTFGDRVGWRVNSQFISYSAVTYNTSAPRGHLPFCGGFCFGFRLFSRIETCRL